MKEKLASCSTVGEAMDFFKTLNKSTLNDFIVSLEKAKEYIDLTMRDDYMLNQAKWELSNR